MEENLKEGQSPLQRMLEEARAAGAWVIPVSMRSLARQARIERLAREHSTPEIPALPAPWDRLRDELMRAAAARVRRELGYTDDQDFPNSPDAKSDSVGGGSQ